MKEYLTKAPIPRSSVVEAEFLYSEIFEGTINDHFYAMEDVSRCYKTPRYALIGNYSAYFYLTAVWPSAGDSAVYSKDVLVKRAPRMSLFSYVMPDITSLEGRIFAGYSFAIPSEKKYYIAEVSFESDTRHIWIRTGADTYVDLGKVDGFYFGVYLPIELVFNTVTKKYVKVLVGGKEFDASAHSLYEHAYYWLWGTITCGVKALQDDAIAGARFGSLLLRALPD